MLDCGGDAGSVQLLILDPHGQEKLDLGNEDDEGCLKIWEQK